MSDMIRDAPLGQLIRLITRNKFLQYPEEREGFQLPTNYRVPGTSHSKQYDDVVVKEQLPAPTFPPVLEEDAISSVSSLEGEKDLDLARIPTARSESEVSGMEKHTTARTQRSTTGIERISTREALQVSSTRADLEKQFTNATLPKGPTQPIDPQHLEDGTVVVDWYNTDDPENPQNWSFKKKAFVTFQINFYTFAVYMGSAIYTPSVEGVMQRFGVSSQQASLGLSMYVLAYGIGPLLFSPLSEIPRIGRSPPYLITFGIFVILSLPAALVDNFSGLIALRFLQGFFGSPCLATGGASLGDMYSLIKLPYVLSMWALAATCGPSLGPIISGFSVAAENWRWSLWEILWLSGPVWILLFLCLPETYPQTILLRRAQRLRKATGNENLKAQSEVSSANRTPKELVVEALWVPIKTILLDPAIAFTAIYTALIYGIYYSFFEAFPIVYLQMYGFNLGEMGLTFLSISVGVFISLVFYWSYVYYVVEPEIRSKGLGEPERRLIPALYASILLPVGLFIFAWTANPSVHWIGSTVGICVFTIGIFLVIQCIFLYLPLVYPQYAASLFAGNDFARSSLAAGTIHFSSPMFKSLHVGPGVSLLAGLTTACIFGVYILYFFGDKLRARSRFAAK